MNESDRIRLRHMLQAAQVAIQLIEGETRASLDHDLKLQLALTRSIEVIGEAASKITEETRAAYPHIPWSGIIGMRNVLIHAYFNIDLDKLWSTTFTDLVPLIAQLQAILNEAE